MPAVQIDEGRFRRMEDAVGEIRDAVVAIARLEEKHQETRESVGRAFDRIDKLEAVQHEQELVMATISGQIVPLQETRGWIVAGVLGVLALVGVAVVSLVVGRGA